ncbi:DUF6146 family protein [Tenacibaculum maritimum]|uniref:DUF6146 family protein n=1 Tax=Tenacibaculum maritimum TaxID=107401 RepID=UPI00388D6CD3
MKFSKTFFLLCCIGVCIWSCTPSLNKITTTSKEPPVVIANDSLAYEIIIIDPGFTMYLNTISKPTGYYSQNYLENKNLFYVSTWNYRVTNVNQFNPNIYENIIDYDPNINYGYEVNYKLFNYFEFAQQKYRMQLK